MSRDSGDRQQAETSAAARRRRHSLLPKPSFCFPLSTPTRTQLVCPLAERDDGSVASSDARASKPTAPFLIRKVPHVRGRTSPLKAAGRRVASPVPAHRRSARRPQALNRIFPFTRPYQTSQPPASEAGYRLPAKAQELAVPTENDGTAPSNLTSAILPVRTAMDTFPVGCRNADLLTASWS